MSSDKRKWTIPRRFVTNLCVSPPGRSHRWSPPLAFFTSIRRSGPVTILAPSASRCLPPPPRPRCVSARALLADPSATMVSHRARFHETPHSSHGSLRHAGAVGSRRMCARFNHTGSRPSPVRPAGPRGSTGRHCRLRHMFFRDVRPTRCPRRGGALPSCSSIPAVESRRHCAMESQERACAPRRSPTRGPVAQVILRHRSHGHNIWCSPSGRGTTSCALVHLRRPARYWSRFANASPADPGRRARPRPPRAHRLGALRRRRGPGRVDGRAGVAVACRKYSTDYVSQGSAARRRAARSSVTARRRCRSARADGSSTLPSTGGAVE